MERSLSMEFHLTGKHLAASAIAGLLVCFFIVYLGTANPGRYFYEGPYNTHDPAFTLQNPHTKRNHRYDYECADCHAIPWEPVEDKTCQTSGCHNSLDPAMEGRSGLYGGGKFNPVGYKYHESVKSMSCGACHRIHEHRIIEDTKYYGPQFDHALMVPQWDKNFGCAQCHEKGFDDLGMIAAVLRTVPSRQGKPFAELEAESAKWLSEGGRKRLELGGGAGGALAELPEFQPYNPDALRGLQARGGGEVLLYFRNKPARWEGGVCRYLEEEVLRLPAIAEAIRAKSGALVVDWEENADAWREFGMFRAGSFALASPDGAVKRLHFFHSPSDLLAFIRGPQPAAPQKAETETTETSENSTAPDANLEAASSEPAASPEETSSASSETEPSSETAPSE
jgi:hypothetical protein